MGSGWGPSPPSSDALLCVHMICESVWKLKTTEWICVKMQGLQ